MSIRDITTDTDASNHSYAGLENANTNSASWIDFREVEDTDDFDSESDWHKTHKRTFYSILDQMNRGYVNGARRNKPFYTYQSNLHLSQALSGTLGLTSEQKSEATKWFRLVDFQKLGHPIIVSGFSICARIVHEDERDQRNCHPQTPTEKWPSEFRELFENWSSRYQNRYSKVYGVIDHRIRNWSFEDDEPASERMDRYGTYEAYLHHSSNSADDKGMGVYKPLSIPYSEEL